MRRRYIIDGRNLLEIAHKRGDWKGNIIGRLMLPKIMNFDVSCVGIQADSHRPYPYDKVANV